MRDPRLQGAFDSGRRQVPSTVAQDNGAPKEKVGWTIFRRKATAALLDVIWLIALLGCEVGTSVRVAAGPTYSLDGSGRLASFVVYGPRAGHRIATPLDTHALMWSLEPQRGATNGLLVVNREVTHGKILDGYVQTFPGHGPANTLSPGLVYAFEAETTGGQRRERFLLHGWEYADRDERAGFVGERFYR
jgi:hypothetical protein